MTPTTIEQSPPLHDQTQRVGFLQVLKNKNFRVLWCAQVVSSMGSWLTLFALLNFAGFHLKIGGSELGRMAAGFMLTQALVLPLAGVLIDRLDLKKTMIACELTRSALVMLLMFTSQLAYLYPLVLALSAAACLFMSGLLAATPRLVRKQELMVANSLTTQVFEVSAVLAPIVAGIAITRLGPRLSFLINSLTFLLSASCLSLLRLSQRASGGDDPPPITSPRPGLTSLARDFVAGLRFVVTNRLITFVVASAAITLLAAGWVHTLGVIYVRDVLRAGPETLGVLLSTLGVGAVVGLFVIGKLGQAASRLKMIVVGILVIGIGIFALTLVRNKYEAFVLAFLLGIAAIAVLLPSQTLVQEQTPPTLMGRVGSVSWSLILLSQAASVGLAGAAADWVGIKSLYRLASAILIVTATGGLFWVRAKHQSPPRLR